MAVKEKTKEEAKDQEPVEEGVKNPTLTGQVDGYQTIPGPRDMTGTAVSLKKESQNKKYHKDISDKYGPDVVHTRDNVILLNGLHYGPGLVNCGPGTMKVSEDPNAPEVPISDVVRAAVDKVYEHPEPEEEQVQTPSSPVDMSQITIDTSVAQIPRGDE